MRVRGSLLSLTVALSLGACASSGQTAPAGNATAAATPAAGEAQGALVATLVGSVPGEVRLAPASGGNRTQATISIRNGRMQQEYAWQIRRGQCRDQGAVEIATPGIYPSLVARGDGTAEYRGSIGLRFPSTSDQMFVEILAGRGSDTVLSCGQLSPANS